MNVLRVGVAFDDAPDGQAKQGGLKQPDREDGLRIGRHAEQPEDAPHPERREQLLDDGRDRGRVDRVIGPRGRDLTDLFGQRTGLRVDGVGRAEFGGKLAPALV